MKKFTLLFLFLTTTFSAKSQSYIGFLSDNYSGVNAVISNPANILDTPYKLDINLVGVSAFGSNDYYGINIFDALKNGYDFDLESKKFPLTDNSAAANLDILGPAFMFNLNKNSSIAIFTRARSFVNVNKINGSSIQSVDDDTTDDFNINEGDFDVLGHAWAELGITFAHMLIKKQKYSLKGGFTLKYLQGGVSAYAVGENVSVNYDADGTDLGGGETTGSISSTGLLNYARSVDFDNDDYDYEFPKNAKGFGGDIGLVYVLRPDNVENTTSNININQDQYKLKVGLSVTDIGFIDYKNGIKQAYNITNTDVSEEEFDNSDDFGTFLESFYSLSNTGKGFKVDLPTALHLNVDWNFNRKLYLNFNTDLSLMSKDRKTANRISNTTSLTPRFESKWFSFYLPLSVIENNGFRIGAGIRTGPLYIGSGSVISALVSDNNKEADVYAGLKIGLLKVNNKDKDKDKDGVIDELDDCPKVFGFIDNNGCPWGDKDEDTVLDNVDSCPEESGPVENNGCPWEDTDGDGVLDKNDKCKYTAGTLANFGCPKVEVTKEVQKELNDYAKVILFNYGKSTIMAESYEVLNEIVKILEEYPSAKFTIEGHTDSIGSYGLNKSLSEKRAQSVKNFLVDNGIDSSRLTAIGYGERKPIATNMYKDGRAKNRRVEINLDK
jgi:outer membrane protein OmpA-like peptidoglycan-associated protein